MPNSMPSEGAKRNSVFWNGGSPALALPIDLSGLDQAGAALEVAGIEQAPHRHVHEGGIAEIERPVGKGEAAGLGDPVHRLGPGLQRGHVLGSSMPRICSTAMPPELGGPMPQTR